MKITLPELSLVLFIGPSGAGKSSFGRKHFLPTEVVSSDFCRGLVSDNENDQSATGDAFDLLQAIVRKRLTRGKLTVIDATNVQPESRKSLNTLLSSKGSVKGQTSCKSSPARITIQRWSVVHWKQFNKVCLRQLIVYVIPTEKLNDSQNNS